MSPEWPDYVGGGWRLHERGAAIHSICIASPMTPKVHEQIGLIGSGRHQRDSSDCFVCNLSSYKPTPRTVVCICIVSVGNTGASIQLSKLNTTQEKHFRKIFVVCSNVVSNRTIFVTAYVDRSHDQPHLGFSQNRFLSQRLPIVIRFLRTTCGGRTAESASDILPMSSTPCSSD